MHVDPGGPAGTEYEIPAARALDQTHAEPSHDRSVAPGATSGGDPPAPGGADSRLFGVGVDQRTSARRARDNSGAGGAPGRSDAGRSQPRAGARPVAAGKHWASVADGNAGSSVLWLVPGIAIAVLAAAGALVLVLRRSAARPA